jgi:hypothetical protein
MSANAVAKRDTADLKVVIAPAPVSITERRDEIAEKAILQGNLYDLTSAAERVNHYLAVCQSLGLNPFTKPFDYLELDGPKGDKVLTLYAKRDAAEQLRKMHGVSIRIVKRQTVESAPHRHRAGDHPDGRTDEAIGAVPIGKEGASGRTSGTASATSSATARFVPPAPNDLANALMKAETKAKRRVTLSICGLGFMDETEIETVKSAPRLGQPRLRRDHRGRAGRRTEPTPEEWPGRRWRAACAGGRSRRRPRDAARARRLRLRRRIADRVHGHRSSTACSRSARLRRTTSSPT